jgi:hypothetical protein
VAHLPRGWLDESGSGDGVDRHVVPGTWGDDPSVSPGHLASANRAGASTRPTSRPRDLAAAIFDWLIVQTDRNGSNWLGVPALPEHGQPGQHRLRLHDHGHAFVPSGTLNSSFYSMKQGQRIPPMLIDDLREAERHLPECGLDDLLGSGTTHALVTKLQQLVNDGSLL